jgi:hypothetical protein
MSEQLESLETDQRFPSGRWVGFWLQKEVPPGKFPTEVHLTFRAGKLTGEGRDKVGKFTFEGSYDLQSGRCRWIKRYAGKHAVFYQGFNEGKGIWGTWDIPLGPQYGSLRGGFHIWPEGMPDPTLEHLSAEADLPVETTEETPAAVGAADS